MGQPGTTFLDFTQGPIGRPPRLGTLANPAPGGGGGFLSGLFGGGGAGRGVGGYLLQNALPIALTAGSFIYQNRQRRKLKRRLNELQEQNRGIEIRFTPSAGEIGISYGYSGAPGYAVYAKTERRLPSVPGTFGTLAAHPDASKYDEFLLVQYVIGASGISRLLDLHINNDPVASDGLAELVSHELRQNEASPHVTAFTTERDANAIGTGFSVVNGFYRFDNDNRLISGIPSLLAFVEGELVRPLSGGSFGTETFSRNAVLCLADYLTSSIYGPNFSDDDLELSTWQKAADLMEFNLSFQSIPDFHGVNIRDWGLAECNGNILTPGDFLDSLNAFLGIIPGSIVWRNLDGKWAISVPDVRTPLEDQIVGELTEDDFLVAPGKEYPDATLMLNGQTVEFSNLFDDYAADSLTYKNAGFLAKDRGIVLENTIGLELCGTPYHAQLISSTNVKTSRRPTYPGMVCRAHTLRFEPGDVVRINAPNFGINGDIVRIQDMRLFNDGAGNLFTTIDALEHSLSDFLYEPIKEATMRGVPKKNYRPGGILGAVLELIPNKVRQLKTTWDAESDTNNTKEYVVELAEMTNESDPIPESAWVTVGTVPEGEVREHLHNITDLTRCYTARVTPRTSNNVKGKPVRTNTVMAGNARIDNQVSMSKPNLDLSALWQLVPGIVSNWPTAFDSLKVLLAGRTHGDIASDIFELVSDNVRTGEFNPRGQRPDYPLRGGGNIFLYQTPEGQLFARQQGGTARKIVEVVGVTKPDMPGAFPELPRTRGIQGPPGIRGPIGAKGPPGDPGSGGGGSEGICKQIPPIEIPRIQTMTEDCDYIATGQPRSIQFPEASGGNGDLHYRLKGIPKGMTFDPATRMLTGSPTEPGNHMVTYEVIDSPVDESEKCDCCPDPDQPEAPSLPPIPAPVDDCDYVSTSVGRSIQLPEATHGTGKKTYSVEGIPDGMTFNPTTRMISGRPKTPGNYQYKYTVMDEDMRISEQVAMIRVEDAPGPYVNAIDDITAEVGKPINSLLGEATGGSGSGYTYQLRRPDGASAYLGSFDEANRMMSGTPDFSDVGPQKMSLIAKDGEGNTFCRDFMVNVVDSAPQPNKTCLCAPRSAGGRVALPKTPLLS